MNERLAQENYLIKNQAAKAEELADEAISYLRALVDEVEKFKTEFEDEGIVTRFVPAPMLDAVKRWLEEHQ